MCCMSLTTHDMAWAAGLFEGEGSIQLYPDKRREGVWLRWLGLAMTDEDVVRRFREVVGAGHISLRPSPPTNPHWSPCWYWQASRWLEIERILGEFMPYFGDRRRAKAEEMLAHAPAEPRRKLSPGQIVEIRRLHAEGESQAQIGRDFGVHQSLVSRIVKGQIYAGVSA